MGLDMYAYKTRTPLTGLDFERPRDADQIHYWRKHYGVHAWMERLYRAKGAQAHSSSFPCSLSPPTSMPLRRP